MYVREYYRLVEKVTLTMFLTINYVSRLSVILPEMTSDAYDGVISRLHVWVGRKGKFVTGCSLDDGVGDHGPTTDWTVARHVNHHLTPDTNSQEITERPASGVFRSRQHLRISSTQLPVAGLQFLPMFPKKIMELVDNYFLAYPVLQHHCRLHHFPSGIHHGSGAHHPCIPMGGWGWMVQEWSTSSTNQGIQSCEKIRTSYETFFFCFLFFTIFGHINI